MPGSTRQPLAFSFLLSKLPKPPLLFSTGGSYGSCRSTKGQSVGFMCALPSTVRSAQCTVPNALVRARQPAGLCHCETLAPARDGRGGTHPHGNGLLYAQPICELHNPLQGRAGRASVVDCTSGSPNEAKHSPHRLWGQGPVTVSRLLLETLMLPKPDSDAATEPTSWAHASATGREGRAGRHRAHLPHHLVHHQDGHGIVGEEHGVGEIRRLEHLSVCRDDDPQHLCHCRAGGGGLPQAGVEGSMNGSLAKAGRRQAAEAVPCSRCCCMWKCLQQQSKPRVPPHHLRASSLYSPVPSAKNTSSPAVMATMRPFLPISREQQQP